MTSLTLVLGSQRRALEMAGVSRGTWHYRQAPREGVASPIHQGDRAYESRISESDRARIEERIKLAWCKSESVDWAFASTWDEGIMLASRRTWWRIAAQIQDQIHRPKPHRKTSKRVKRDVPVLIATGPGQVWSWDITDLYSPWSGKTFKAYKIIDIYSRDIKGYRVEDREFEGFAAQMFSDAIKEHGAPRIVHADNGASMTSRVLRELLSKAGITMTHNRPYVSNDNPFSESAFKTMKYRPNYPRIFETLDDARSYIARYVHWYNTQHKHTGIALFSPAEVSDGTWKHKWEVREKALQRYYERYPERFTHQPITPSPADTVGINHRKHTITKM